VDNVGILCDKDNDFLHDYSRRCIERLTGHSLFSVPFPFLSAYLEANIKKETDKDRLIIEHAAEALASGKKPGDVDIDEIFEKTKIVDKAFVRRLLIPSFSIQVRYEDIADIRKKRIALLSTTAGEVLQSWGSSCSFSEVVRNTYSESQFREIILNILHLYNQETRKLTDSIKFFSPFNRAIGMFAETVFDTMEAVAEAMVDEYAARLFRGECACTERT
jgi:hypothetical protein